MIDLPILGTISLQISPETRQQRRLKSTTFLLVMLLMIGSFCSRNHLPAAGFGIYQDADGRVGYLI